LQLAPYGFWGPLVEFQKKNAPALYGFSSHIVPKPPDWRSGCHVTGYWFLDQPNYVPPPQLLDFIQSGTPPVYIGFGSMSERDPHATLQIFLKALQLSRQRGILLSGWADLPRKNLADDVYLMDSVPHDWLFPKMRAVIHHAGAGTTGAALRAGIPNIAIPFFGDQNFWAARVFALGVGPKPVLRKNLTAENLADAIQKAITDAQIQKNADQLGQKIQAEKGVANAIEILETKVL
jgi:UDP:flavonoid glycosyltransferase YjiC (YdhE family)